MHINLLCKCQLFYYQIESEQEIFYKRKKNIKTTSNSSHCTPCHLITMREKRKLFIDSKRLKDTKIKSNNSHSYLKCNPYNSRSLSFSFWSRCYLFYCYSVSWMLKKQDFISRRISLWGGIWKWCFSFFGGWS